MSEHSIRLDELGRPLLDQFSEEGFVDCTFRIAARSSKATRHSLRLVASYNGSEVGFSAVVRRGIRGGFNSDLELIQEHVYRPAVEFHRSGPESDEFVSTLATLYGQSTPKMRMVDVVSFTGIALHQDPVDMETEPIRIKLFGCDSQEQVERDEYFETFFNLDLVSGFVFWNEKDPDYRCSLLRGLSLAG